MIRLPPSRGSAAMPVRSPYPDVEIPDVSLTAFLFGDFGDRVDAPAFIDGPSGRAITFGELAGMVDKIAAALNERGIGTGDVVGLFAPNSPEWAAAFHGVLRANAVVTSANSLYTPGELAHQLADSGAKLLVTVSAFLDRARAGARRGRAARGRRRHARRRPRRHVARRSPRHDGRAARAHDDGRRHRGAAVLLGHHRAGEGRDPHAPQPRRQPLPDRGRWATSRPRRRSWPCCRSSTSTA